MIEGLAHGLGRPAPFEPHDAPFWDDPYIGAQMLAAHLDPTTDAASHRPEIIRQRVDHLLNALGLQAGDRLLDLGCGPGLYAQLFAEHGVAVTGVDISPGSIDHARARAGEAGLEIDFRLGDYTRDALGEPYDAAVMIYKDFGVLPDEPRDRLLAAVAGSLRPGGCFAFDASSLRRRRVANGAITVARHERGFWRPGPHLVLETTYRYPHHLDLWQYAVIDAGGGVATYRVWDRAYSAAQLRRLLGRHGLSIESVWADLTGEPWRADSPTIAVVARYTTGFNVRAGNGLPEHQLTGAAQRVGSRPRLNRTSTIRSVTRPPGKSLR